MNGRPLIIALDFPDGKEVGGFLKKLPDQKLYVKVGMELFYQEGPSIIDQLKSAGHDIFLDLKLHDIPQTVKQAMKGLAKLEVNLVNVHAAGGSAMMQAAIEGLEAGTRAGSKRPDCIAVTQLTSTSEAMLNHELLIGKGLNETVLHYAKLAYESGLDGIVCSSLEVPEIYQHLDRSFHTITPGIRLAEDSLNDQVRVATPEKARELGSTAIVVGRSITKAKDPLTAYLQMKNAWEGLPV
ncbi:orotidine-5'-phosphate decarboxylase [Metabacillus hrfriensis]|uniref:Orotidine-5'-phosphate decarboxylase n=1 Tax=Metabacillus hrfriensis TaxID=3048891 RepID=A0ACD4RH86_9BACI|nr:orotidine-5'-phosphate decarboxylase [Metabacillus sp. CT-WN-B3]WHZ59761.1 orotidine-5'-phosphate decarboxylase [Metabacillus sp. CT-WN-B3]